MFAVYQKIISPASSPVLGPVSPNLAPMTHANNANNVNNANANANANANNANANNANNIMESLSLCNYCCSPRTKCKKDDAPSAQDSVQDSAQDSVQDSAQDSAQYPIKSKYEFGHATHYIYGVTTPRLLCDFE